MAEESSKPRTIKVLGTDVNEDMLKTSLRDVLEKRGLTAHLIIEDKDELERRLKELQGEGGFPYSDYANIYKYAFFG